MEDEYRYYETLGLDRNASLSEIKKAYRSLAKTYHPDVSSHPRAIENFQKIQQAYEALSDTKKRGEYDAYLDTLEESVRDESEDDIHIENEFYVHNEPIAINGRDQILDSVHHVIVDGQEFIEYNGEFLSYNRGDFPFDTQNINKEFYVPNEGIAVNGKEYTFKNAHHVVINGQEYVEYDGDFLPFNRQEYQDSSSSGGGGILRKLANLAMVLVIAFTLYHGYIIATSGNGADISVGNLVQSTSTEEELSQMIKDAIDSESTTTRNYALSLVDKSHGGERNIAQVCDIWDKCYNKWTYISDPKGLEYFSPASNTIRLGLKGDCDDFAILIASLVESTGGSTRVILAQGANGGGHAYAEVYVTSSKTAFDSIAQYICKRYNCRSVAYRIVYDKDQTPRYWLNLDWQSKHPGGKYYESDGTLTAYYPNGYWYKFKSNT